MPCVWGKTKEDQHRRIKEDEEARMARTPVMGLDYLFLKGSDYAARHGAEEVEFELKVLNVACRKSGGGGCAVVRQKGSAEPYAAIFVNACVKCAIWNAPSRVSP